MSNPMTRRGAIALGAAAAGTLAVAGSAQAQPATPTFAPLPQDAKPRATPPEGYLLDRIGNAMYAVTAGGNQAYFVVTSAGVVVIDAPPSLSTFLPAAIKRVTGKRVTHLIYSHSHNDHIGGASAFGDVHRIAHSETATTLRTSRDANRPMPTRTFDDKYTLTVGDHHLQLSYPGNNHEAGNILIEVPRQRAAVMVDVVLPGWAPFRAWGTGDSIPGVLRAHDMLAKLNIETFAGGHVHRLGTMRDITSSRDFTYDLWHTTSRVLGQIDSKPFFAAVEPGNNWAAFSLYLDAIAAAASPEIIQRWTGRLAGVDVFTRENITTVALSQMIDAPKDLK